MAAAEQLVGLGLQDSQLFQQAFQELLTANQISSWRGEGNLNQSLVHIKQNKTAEAIKSLTDSLKVDPYFEPSYINLADIYRSQGNTAAEQKTLDAGLLAVQNSHLLYYSRGLFHIRQKQRQLALEDFRHAMLQAPDDPQYAYVYFLTLDSMGKTQLALQELQFALPRYKQAPMLMQLATSLRKKLHN